MRLAMLALLLAPLSAWAAQPCAFEAPRQMQLELAGVHAVTIEVNAYDLHLQGVAGATRLDLDGRACASDAKLLEQLVVTQRRDGDRLVLTLGEERKGLFPFKLFGSSSASLKVDVRLPRELPVTVKVGSGDANVTTLDSLSAVVGSGDLDAGAISGTLRATLGSGDIKARDVGSLDVDVVGSGDLDVRGVQADARVGSIGSGDVDLENVGGKLAVGAIGSGELEAKGVRGALRIDAIGSGEAKLVGIGGDVSVGTLGAGGLDVRDVGGDLRLDARGSGDVSHAGVKGRISLPR